MKGRSLGGVTQGLDGKEDASGYLGLYHVIYVYICDNIYIYIYIICITLNVYYAIRMYIVRIGFAMVCPSSKPWTPNLTTHNIHNINTIDRKHFRTTNHKHPTQKQSEQLSTYPNPKTISIFQQDLSCWKNARLNWWNIITKQYHQNHNINSSQTTSQQQKLPA
jgi:hypothetical protein